MYFHTQAGYDASWLLAQHEMFQGHPIAASALLDDIVILPRAINRLGKGVLVLHAAACKLANRKLPATLDGVSGQAGQVSIAGAEQTGPKQGELAQWLDQFYGAVGKLPRWPNRKLSCLQRQRKSERCQFRANAFEQCTLATGYNCQSKAGT